jgi:hypothetical protein
MAVLIYFYSNTKKEASPAGAKILCVFGQFPGNSLFFCVFSWGDMCLHEYFTGFPMCVLWMLVSDVCSFH